MAQSVPEADVRFSCDVDWINEWPDLWPPNWKTNNWSTFTPIWLQFEHGMYKGLYFEVNMIVLGLGFSAQWWDREGRRKFAEGMERWFQSEGVLEEE